MTALIVGLFSFAMMSAIADIMVNENKPTINAVT